MNNQSRIQE